MNYLQKAQSNQRPTPESILKSINTIMIDRFELQKKLMKAMEHGLLYGCGAVKDKTYTSFAAEKVRELMNDE